LTFDLETGMRVASKRWGALLPNCGTLGLWVLELVAMYATDGQTDRRTKATLIGPFPTGGSIIIILLLTNKKYVLSNSESVQCNFFYF